MFKSKKEKKIKREESEKNANFIEEICRKLYFMRDSSSFENQIVQFPHIKHQDDRKILHLCNEVLKSIGDLKFSLVIHENTNDSILEYYPIFYLIMFGFSKDNFSPLSIWEKRYLYESQINDIILFDKEHQRDFIKRQAIKDGIEDLENEIKNITPETLMMFGFGRNNMTHYANDKETRDMLEKVGKTVTDTVFEKHKIQFTYRVGQSITTTNEKYAKLHSSLVFSYSK